MLNHRPLLGPSGGMAPPQPPSSFCASLCQPASPSSPRTQNRSRPGAAQFLQVAFSPSPFQVRPAGMAWAQLCFSSGKQDRRHVPGPEWPQAGVGEGEVASCRSPDWASFPPIAGPFTCRRVVGTNMTALQYPSGAAKLRQGNLRPVLPHSFLF